MGVAESDIRIVNPPNKNKAVSAPSIGHFEAVATTLFLGRCEACGEKHPLAFKPVPVDTEHCPKCGLRVSQPGGATDNPAVITDGSISMWVGNKFLAAAKWLMKLRKELK